jgi:hypothetical protein
MSIIRIHHGILPTKRKRSIFVLPGLSNSDLYCITLGDGASNREHKTCFCGVHFLYEGRYSLRGSTMDLGLKNKVALVLAASKGLGRASAAALAEEGALVAIGARNKQQLEKTAQDLQQRWRTPIWNV